MVKHRVNGEEWWCLPGGGVEHGETAVNAAIRELLEECSVNGKVVRQTSQVSEEPGLHTTSFLIDIGDQEPQMGVDPELSPDGQVIVDMQWLTLAEIPERDRAYLWASGLLTVPMFLEEVLNWGDILSYPVDK
jgi:ADP-ribose pyrophosphatase YjhB (NUDIX family)